MNQTVSPTKSEIINIISKEYAHLNDNCKQEFQDCSRLFSLKKGETLVKEGQYADKVYFIVSGSARAFYLKDGKDITDWFAFENDFISSINSFFQSIPSPHFIEVLEDSELLEIGRDDIMSLSDKYHDFERLTNRITTYTLLKLQDRVVSMQFQTAEQKYLNLLAAYPTITQRVPLTHIASYIGITLETLSRIRKKSRI